MQDLPTGWGAETNNSPKQGFCGKPPTDSVVPPLATAEAYFAKATLGPYLIETATQYADEATAARAMTTLRQAAGSCTNFKDATDASTTHNIGALSFPALGNETFALRLSTGGSGTFDYAFIRQANAVMEVGSGGLIAEGLDESLVRKALDRLSAAQRS